MSMNLTKLSRVIPEHHDRPEGSGDDHPMRVVVREAAFSPDGWTKDRLETVQGLFGAMASEWALRTGVDRTEALTEALDRVQPTGKNCLELGCGTGSVLRFLRDRFANVLGADLSIEMLRNCNNDGVALAQADSSALPIGNGKIDVCVIVNSLLFPTEINRLLTDDGVLIWVSTNGDRTPIYLSPEDVLSALGDEYYGVFAECGNGVWSCFSRSERAFDRCTSTPN